MNLKTRYSATRTVPCFSKKWGELKRPFSVLEYCDLATVVRYGGD